MRTAAYTVYVYVRVQGALNSIGTLDRTFQVQQLEESILGRRIHDVILKEAFTIDVNDFGNFITMLFSYA